MKKNRRKVPCRVDGCEWAGFSFNLAKHQRSHLKRRIRDPVTGLISWVAVEPILPADPGEEPVDAPADAPGEAPGEAHNLENAPRHAPVEALGDESKDLSEEERMEEDEAERNERMRRQIGKHLRIISKKKRRRPKRKRGAMQSNAF